MTTKAPATAGRIDMRELHAQRQAAQAALETALAAAKPLAEQFAAGTLDTAGQTKLDAADAEVAARTGEVEALSRQIASESTRLRGEAALHAVRTVAAGDFVSREPHPVAAGGFHSFAHFAHEARRSTVAHPTEGMRAYMDRVAGIAATERAAGVQMAIGDALTSDGDAGFLVPPQFADQVWAPMFPGDVDLVDLIPAMATSGNQLVMPTYEGMPWGTSAVKAYFRDAATTAMTESKPNFRGLTVDNFEVHAVTSVDANLQDDAPYLESMLRSEMNRAMRYTVSNRFYSGTGAGEPQGYMSAPSLITVARKTASQVAADDLLGMMARVVGFAAAVWVVHPSVLPALGVMTVGDIPVWLPNGSLQGEPTGRLLGRPVYFLEHAEVLGTAGDVTLINPQGYLRTQRTGAATGYAVSPHVYFLYNASTIRLTARVGGKVKLAEPIKSRASDSYTYSHVVRLGDAA